MGGTVSFESFSSLGIKGKYAELFEKKQYPTGTKTIPVRVRKLDRYWPHMNRICAELMYLPWMSKAGNLM